MPRVMPWVVILEVRVGQLSGQGVVGTRTLSAVLLMDRKG